MHGNTTEGARSDWLAFGPFRLDLAADQLLHRDQRVHLTPKAFALLRLFAGRPGELVTKRELFTQLWAGTAVTDDALSRCIRELRRALADDSRKPRFLETVHRRGFRFIAPVVRPREEGEPYLPFVGRERELAAAREWLARAADGPVAVLRISGEPGVGKTRLAREIALSATRAGALALWSQTPGDGGGPPFSMWRQVLDGQGSALCGTADAIAAHDGRQRAFDGVLSELERMTARRRVLLVLDDLQGADRDSLRLLGHLMQEWQSAQLAVVCTFRDVGAPHNATLREILEASPGAGHLSLELRGLASDEVSRLLALRFGDERARKLAAYAHEKSGGNPLYLNELVQLIPPDADAPPAQARVPETIRELLARRLDAVSPVCTEVLTAAAVAGSESQLDLIREAAQLGPDALAEGIEEALAQRLLQRASDAPGQLRFSHGLVREVVYERTRPGLRARLHRRVACALEADSSPSRGDYLPAIAHHFGRAVLGGDTGKAIHYALQAGERALALFAFEEAAAHYESALDALEAEDPLDLARICRASMAGARAHALCGRTQEALALARRSVEHARRSRSTRLFRAAVVVYCELQPSYARDPQAVALLDEALSHADDRDLATRARLVALRSLMCFLDADGRNLAGLSREALELARRSDDTGALLEGLRVRSLALAHPSSEHEWRARCEERIALAASAGDAIHGFQARMHRLEHRMQLGDASGVRSDLEAMDAIAERVRAPSMTATLLSVRAGLAIAAGSLVEARGLAERALAIGRRVDPGEAWAIAVLQLGTVSVFEERASEVGADVRTGIVSHPHISLFQVGEISLLSQTGAVEEARRRLLALARDRFEALPRDLSFGLSLSGLATSCARLGCVEAAEPLYELLLPYAGRTLTLLCHYAGGCASRYLGVLSALLGRWDEAARHFELAIGVDGAAGALAWQAYAILDYARMLLARGLARDVARARALLDGALAAAQGLGIPALEREVSEAVAPVS